MPYKSTGIKKPPFFVKICYNTIKIYNQHKEGGFYVRYKNEVLSNNT